MKLTQKQLRSLIESVVTEAPGADDVHGDAYLVRTVTARITKALREVAEHVDMENPVSAMAAYNQADRGMRDLLEILEGHPENVR